MCQALIPRAFCASPRLFLTVAFQGRNYYPHQRGEDGSQSVATEERFDLASETPGPTSTWGHTSPSAPCCPHTAMIDGNAICVNDKWGGGAVNVCWENPEGQFFKNQGISTSSPPQRQVVKDWMTTFGRKEELIGKAVIQVAGPEWRENHLDGRLWVRFQRGLFQPSCEGRTLTGGVQ